jgi:hypothetical protein
MKITDSEFSENTATNRGNNIDDRSNGVTCDDGNTSGEENTFESSGGGGNDSDSDGNSPAGLCD